MGTEYITNTAERRKSRNERKTTICRKAQEMTAKCGGGEVIVQYKDENNKTWTYVSTDELWTRYITTGIVPASSERMNMHGKAWEPAAAQETYPTPTKTGCGDCNFVMVQIVDRDTNETSSVNRLVPVYSDVSQLTPMLQANTTHADHVVVSTPATLTVIPTLPTLEAVPTPHTQKVVPMPHTQEVVPMPQAQEVVSMP